MKYFFQYSYNINDLKIKPIYPDQKKLFVHFIMNDSSILTNEVAVLWKQLLQFLTV